MLRTGSTTPYFFQKKRQGEKKGRRDSPRDMLPRSFPHWPIASLASCVLKSYDRPNTPGPVSPKPHQSSLTDLTAFLALQPPPTFPGLRHSNAKTSAHQHRNNGLPDPPTPIQHYRPSPAVQWRPEERVQAQPRAYGASLNNSCKKPAAQLPGKACATRQVKLTRTRSSVVSWSLPSAEPASTLVCALAGSPVSCVKKKLPILRTHC